MKEPELYSAAHCVLDSKNLNYEGKVLVLNPSILKDEYKSASNQLILAYAGFGCDPDSRGRKVYGKYLGDHEDCVYDRHDFIGILDSVHMPSWGWDTLQETEIQEQIEDVQSPNLSL